MREVLMEPGQHCLAQGYTGSGKTTLMKWTVRGFLSLREKLPPDSWETLVWFDRGKNSEILSLAHLSPLRLLIPEGCDMDVRFFDPDKEYDIEKKYFSDAQEIWSMLDRDRINVICLQNFLVDPESFAPVIGRLFKSLIMRARKYAIHPDNCPPSILHPRITLFIDELNNIAPSKGNGNGSAQEAETGGWIQQNIEQLRAHKIRLWASTHRWYGLRAGVRSSFPYNIALPGAIYPKQEKRKLSKFVEVFEKLETGACCFVFKKDVFSPPYKIPYTVPPGESLGYIIYKGEIKKEKRQPRKQAAPNPSTQDLINALTALAAQAQQ